MTDDRAALARPLDLDAYAYVSPKLEKRARPEGGFGLFTVAPISRDETLTVMGGVIASRAQLERLPRRYAGRTIQVEEDLYQISIRSDETADFVNHSCQPNAGIRGQVVMIAMRDIPVGEEITYDYAMSDGSSFDVFACNCGAPACRRRVTGDDWRNTNLWDLYDGYFSDYLARRIATLREENKARRATP